MPPLPATAPGPATELPARPASSTSAPAIHPWASPTRHAARRPDRLGSGHAHARSSPRHPRRFPRPPEWAGRRPGGRWRRESPGPGPGSRSRDAGCAGHGHPSGAARRAARVGAARCAATNARAGAPRREGRSRAAKPGARPHRTRRRLLESCGRPSGALAASVKERSPLHPPRAWEDGHSEPQRSRISRYMRRTTPSPPALRAPLPAPRFPLPAHEPSTASGCPAPRGPLGFHARPPAAEGHHGL